MKQSEAERRAKAQERRAALVQRITDTPWQSAKELMLPGDTMATHAKDLERLFLAGKIHRRPGDRPYNAYEYALTSVPISSGR